MKSSINPLLILLSFGLFGCIRNTSDKTDKVTDSIAVKSTGPAVQGEYHLKGKIANYNNPSKVYLFYTLDGNSTTDSAALINGEFEFKGKLDQPFMANLILSRDGSGNPILKRAQRKQLDIKQIWLEEANIVVNSDDSVSKASISGSSLNDDQAKLNLKLQPVVDKETQLMNIFGMESDKIGESAAKKIYEAKMVAVNQMKMKLVEAFIKEHPDSYLSLYSINTSGISKVNEIEPLYASLSDRLKQTAAGKDMATLIHSLKMINIGSQAPVFIQNDVNGKPVSLKDFKGKYVLIDFWASWCVPCRAENPDVVKAYNKFKDKNFTILGVSLDDENSKQAWIDAIKKDGLTWTQISDLKGWKNNAAALYGVRSIPANFLIDPSGKIIAKNLHGSAIGEALAKFIK